MRTAIPAGGLPTATISAAAAQRIFGRPAAQLRGDMHQVGKGFAAPAVAHVKVKTAPVMMLDEMAIGRVGALVRFKDRGGVHPAVKAAHFVSRFAEIFGDELIKARQRFGFAALGRLEGDFRAAVVQHRPEHFRLLLTSGHLAPPIRHLHGRDDFQRDDRRLVLTDDRPGRVLERHLSAVRATPNQRRNAKHPRCHPSHRHFLIPPL